MRGIAIEDNASLDDIVRGFGEVRLVRRPGQVRDEEAAQ